MNNAQNKDRPTRPLSIVVGVQFDETGVAALRCASRLAAAPEATVHLCHTEGEVQTTPEANEQLLAEGEAKLQKWAASHVLGTPIMAKVELHSALGTPAAAIIQLAVDTDADLIVAGTHDKSTIERITSGSVTHELWDRAPCPLLIARPRNFAHLEKSPAVEPEPSERHAERTLGAGNTYAYRRSIRLAIPQSSVG